MYENGIDVVYELAQVHRDGAWGPHGKITLPGWCAGDPQMAVALHFFGHRDSVEWVRIADWQPHEDAADDDADGRPDPAALLTRWLHDGDPESGRALLSALALDPARVYRAVR